MILKASQTRSSRNLSRCWESETFTLLWNLIDEKSLKSFPVKISNLIAVESQMPQRKSIEIKQ